MERDILAIAISGNFFPKSWNTTTGATADFYVLKGILDKLSADLGAGAFTYAAASGDHPFFSVQSCSVSCPGSMHGIMGGIKDNICSAFDIKNPVFYAELDITDFLSAQLPPVTYRQLQKYPALERDFCFVLGEIVPSSEISQEILSLSPLVEDVTPFDVYRGEKLGPGLRSIAFSVRLRSAERTLTDKEAEDVCSKIVSTMEGKFGATLRK